jgi:putative flippase GtrA
MLTKYKLGKLRLEIFSEKFYRYFFSGVFAFGVDNLVLNILKFYVFEGNGAKILSVIYASKLISSLVGITVSFYLNRRWSFKANEGSMRKQIKRMLFVFIFINILLAAILYSFIYDFLVWQNVLEFGKLSVTISNAITSGIIMFINFFTYKFVVFGNATRATTVE